jgi:hypothetical protein
MATNAVTKQPAQPEKKVRQRSPNYPVVGLEEALVRVGNLFREDGRAAVSSEIAAKHIGYATAHGQAYSVLSALKKFGLLDEDKGKVSLSQRALELLNLPSNDPRRMQALKDAALSPTIYRELIEDHAKTGLPGDEALEAELVTYKSFNPKAVASFVKDFRSTLEFAGLSDFSVLGSSVKVEDEGKKKPKIGDWIQWEHNGILGFAEPKRLTGFSEDGDYAFVEGYNGGLPTIEIIPADPPEQTSPLFGSLFRALEHGKDVQGAKMRQDVCSLTEGEAVIHWPTPLSADSITDLEGWLDLVKRKIKRSASESVNVSELNPKRSIRLGE